MKTLKYLILCAGLFTLLTSEDGCNEKSVSSTGLKQAQTTVKTDLNGHSIEQANIIQRLQEDNKPGSIKHLYIISAYSGQVLIYSTVKGKVTSSGKRLDPSKAVGDYFKVDLGEGHWTQTDEIMGADGTYGSSVEYLYWWDSKGIYHQQYITGGMILHISNEPLAVKNVTINMELNK